MKTNLLVATAMVVSSMYAPAVHAQSINSDKEAKELLEIAAANPSLQNLVDTRTPAQICQDALRPAAQSRFQTEATAGAPTNDGAEFEDTTKRVETSRSGSGTPQVVSEYDSFHRNGHSPNVWANGLQGVTIYPTTTINYATEFVQRVRTAVTCRVWKVTQKGNLVQPPGLQSAHVVLSETRRAGTASETINQPTRDTSTATPFSNLLVCISPGSKPGQWEGMHGFPTADCSAASTAAGGTVISDNAPN